MDIDYNYFVALRKDSAAWNILCAQRAPLILTFVHEAFIQHGRSSAPESELCSYLKDLLIRVNNSLRAELGLSIHDDVQMVYARIEELKKQEEQEDAVATAEGEAKPKKRRKRSAAEMSLLVEEPMYFLRAWSSEESRYFRCLHQGPSGSDPIYDITPQLQKAYSFATSLQEGIGSFVPTASRFKSLLNILREVQESTEGNAQRYIESLEKQKAELDRKIEQAKKGVIAGLTPAQIRERFMQFQHDAISLVDDFRQVEYNLSTLDKEIMQDILGWTGPRGDLLAKYFDQNAYIEQTDQGRAVKSFAQMLLSSDDDDQIVNQIKLLLSLPEIKGLEIDDRLYSIHDQWLALRMGIEKVMGASNKRIKSFLQPQNLDANRGLKERINQITNKVSDLTREYGMMRLPKVLLDLEFPKADITTGFDRGLFVVNEKIDFDTEAKSDSFTINDDKLFDQVVVDPILLYQHIQEMMQDRDQVTLKEIVESYPLKNGVAELTTYIKIAMVDFDVVEDPNVQETLQWEALDKDGNQVMRLATINQITLRRQ